MAKITRKHRTLARKWALSCPEPTDAEEAYAQGLADAQASEGQPGSVLPAYFDNGESLVVSAMSGGRDYRDGMPRKLTLESQKPGEKPVVRDYLQVETKSGRTRSRPRR